MTDQNPQPTTPMLPPPHHPMTHQQATKCTAREREIGEIEYKVREREREKEREIK